MPLTNTQAIQQFTAPVLNSEAALRTLESTPILPHCQPDDNVGRFEHPDSARQLSLGAVWDEYCRRKDVPVGLQWLDEVKNYEATALANR